MREEGGRQEAGSRGGELCGDEGGKTEGKRGGEGGKEGERLVLMMMLVILED